MKKSTLLILYPVVSFSQSGIAHWDSSIWFTMIIILVFILGLVVYSIYWLATLGNRIDNEKSQNESTILSKSLEKYGSKLINYQQRTKDSVCLDFKRKNNY